jgi:chromosome segregation ATPase
MGAETSSLRNKGPTDVDLANYARAYIESYMKTVQSESPEHPPVFFKNRPYHVEVCYMSNGSFCLIFEKSDKPTIAVTTQDWDYVMGKVMSGISYLATAYPHEGFTVEDAAGKGRRDAIRDIRAIESSVMVDATKQLETVIGELCNMGEWTKNPIKMAETAMARLEPVRQMVQRIGPIQDTIGMVDGIRRYQAPQGSATMSPEALKALSDVSGSLGDLSVMLRDVKLQGEKLEDVETHLRGELHDFKIELDKKIAKGLGVILATTDRKIDKAIASSGGGAPVQKDEGSQKRLEALQDELASIKDAVEELRGEAAEESSQDDVVSLRLDELADEVASIRSTVESIKVPEIPVIPEPKIPPELLTDVDKVKAEVGKLSMRLRRIEDYLTAVSAARKSQR